SRNPSPNTFNDKTVNTIATPGNTENQGAVVKYVWASFSIAPQVGIDGSAPTPRKFKAASAKIAFAKINVPCTIIGVIIVGNIYFSIMTTSLAPVELAASIYCTLPTNNATELTSVVITGQKAKVSEIKMFVMLPPRAATNDSANSNAGKASIPSIPRMIIKSSFLY